MKCNREIFSLLHFILKESNVMEIYIIASGVLVILWGLTALIYDKEDWHLDISTGLSILLIQISLS